MKAQIPSFSYHQTSKNHCYQDYLTGKKLHRHKILNLYALNYFPMFIYERVHPEVLLIHLHGFANNVKSSKVLALRDFALKSVGFPSLGYGLPAHHCQNLGGFECPNKGLFPEVQKLGALRKFSRCLCNFELS